MPFLIVIFVLSQEGFKVKEIAGIVDEGRIVTIPLELRVFYTFVVVSEQVDKEIKEAFADLLYVAFVQ